MIFLDTNILVYASDDTDAVKHGIAKRIIEKAIRNDNYLISAQVLNEFSSVMYRKLKRTDEQVARYLNAYTMIISVPLLPSWTRRAVEIKKQYQIQFYDSLLLAAAEYYGCSEFYSEDMSDGQIYCGIKVVNPFEEDQAA